MAVYELEPLRFVDGGIEKKILFFSHQFFDNICLFCFRRYFVMLSAPNVFGVVICGGRYELFHTILGTLGFGALNLQAVLLVHRIWLATYRSLSNKDKMTYVGLYLYPIKAVLMQNFALVGVTVSEISVTKLYPD